MALESKNTKLGQTALTGMQKLLCEDRFVGGVTMEVEVLEKQLLSQMLEAIRVTPSLHEDLQVEVMKVLLCITYSPNFDINGDSILRIAQTHKVRMSSNDSSANIQSRLQRAKEMSDEEKLYRYNGVLYPRIMCPEEHLKGLENIKAREDDIMLVAYPKCGFNWMVGVLRKIITEATGMKTETMMPPLIEFFAPEALKVVDETPSPRFLGTHMHPDNIPTSFYEKKTKMLVVFRNPKDTLVSFYHFSNNNPVLPSGQSWESFYSNFMSGDGERNHDLILWVQTTKVRSLGSYFDHASAWEKRMDDPNVMVVTYEELKQDLSEGIRQITRFLGFTLTEDQVQQIAEGSTFNAMKKTPPTPTTRDRKHHLQKRCGVMQQSCVPEARERFRSLASLRAHLEYRHSYRSPDVITGGFSITGKLPDPLTAAIPWHDMSLPTRRGQQGAGGRLTLAPSATAEQRLPPLLRLREDAPRASVWGRRPRGGGRRGKVGWK
ncbi:hypothetical protein D5F01_LYC21529 [Larimichthys crocea]|uniref:Sulfotransferase n=1 Tax=Larimichthys crocea TaxID=215358 RepID=A0A6G0HPF5_LARCR|nr:hypothetical protein D5F01_LYC21529 [Larimichthys crocea]